MIVVHKTTVGTYHPKPGAEPQWTIVDTRGTIDKGPACENEKCERSCECQPQSHMTENVEDCVGLSFYYLCLDGGDVLCGPCADKEGAKIEECDCP